MTASTFREQRAAAKAAAVSEPVVEYLEVEEDAPAVPERVRTWVYFLLLAASVLVMLATGLAPIWLGDDAAARVVASAGVVSGVLGTIAGGLGVAYRPTR